MHLALSFVYLFGPLADDELIMPILLLVPEPRMIRFEFDILYFRYILHELLRSLQVNEFIILVRIVVWLPANI